jgi:hypothetical protein
MFKKSFILPVILVSLPLALLGYSAQILSPQIAPGPDATNVEINKTLKFLNTEVKFEKGHFINEFTQTEYSCPTEKISETVEVLTSEAHLDVVVGFAEFENKTSSFSIFQTATDKHTSTTLTINLNNPNLNLKKLTFNVPAKHKNTNDKSPKADSNRWYQY